MSATLTHRPLQHYSSKGATEATTGLAIAALPNDWWLCGQCCLPNRVPSADEVARYWAAQDQAMLEHPIPPYEVRAAAQTVGMTPSGPAVACSCRRGPRPSRAPLSGFWNYVIYGDGGRLLYVGMTRQPRARVKSHRTREGWGELLRTFLWIECETAAEMVADEASSIAWLNPPLNSAGAW